jgi:hypothetical protein
MNKVTYIIKVLFLGILVSVFSLACTDLEEEIYSEVTPDQFFQTEAEFVSALGNAYTQLNSIGGNGNIFSLQEVTSDEIVVPTRGQDWDDGGEWRRLHTHEYAFENGIINNSWVFCYGGVSTCNRLIFQFNELGVEGAEEFIAELRALRAMYYYWLVDLYGNVPIVTDFDVPPDFAPANNSRQEVFNFIEQELTEVLPLLTQEVGGAAYGRVNYYTAQAILAKLYLNAEVYTGTPQLEKALTAVDEIINSGQYSLAPDYYDNFVVNNENSPEFIFAIPYDEVFQQGFVMPMMTLHYASQATYNLTAQPWNGFASLQEFYDSYEDTDVRKQNFLVGPQFSASGERLLDNGAEASDPDGPPLTFTPEINELGPQALRQAGVRIGKWEYELGSTENLNNDLALLRYSDIVLMKAEILFRQGQTAGEALALVNQIRERAGVAPFTELTEENLLAERGREMFAEQTRRSDLIRFGRYNDAWQFKPQDPSDHVNIFPIPRPQLDSNPNLVQNPGYSGGSGG